MFISGCGLLRIDADCEMVEVAGIEPASEGLQRTKTTCVSDPLNFANATYEPAGARIRYLHLVSAEIPEIESQPIPLCDAPARFHGKKRRNVAV